jgi:hypothetical protein
MKLMHGSTTSELQHEIENGRQELQQMLMPGETLLVIVAIGVCCAAA